MDCLMVCVRGRIMLNYKKSTQFSLTTVDEDASLLFHPFLLSSLLFLLLLLFTICLTSSYSHFINDPSFSQSLVATPAPIFPLLSALHSKLSRVANHYPQSQALNLRTFTLSIMCSPSLTRSSFLSLSKPPTISLSMA